MMVATRGYFFTWNELCQYFPEKRIDELRFTILDLHRSGWTRSALMDEFKRSENTLDATLKRYKNAKCAEDCVDKTRAPKNPGRKFSSLKKSVPGIRTITAEYNVEAEREGRPKIGKSWAAKLLTRIKASRKQAAKCQ